MTSLSASLSGSTAPESAVAGSVPGIPASPIVASAPAETVLAATRLESGGSSWSGSSTGRAKARRIELVPVAPPLPKILFTGDAPPPGFELPAVARDESLVSGAQSGAAAATAVSPVGTLGNAIGASLGETVSSGSNTRLTDAPGEVWLTARDPFTVVAHWDRDLPEPAAPEKEWGRGRWWMRLHEGSADGPVVTERPATETSGTVLLPVLESGHKYVAELGYDSHRSGWHGVAISHPVPTPPDRPSVIPEVPRRIEWGTMAPWEGEPGGGQAVGYVPVAPPMTRGVHDASAGVPAVRVEESWEEVPADALEPGALRWSWALWSGAALDSSGELASEATAESEGWMRKGQRIRKTSIGVPLPVVPLEDARPVSSAELTSPAATAGRRDFWFRVNAEVVLHGSTEPDASVTIAGRPVSLRPDGSFSFRFAFPDGDFRLPVEAVSADLIESRKATVRFLRATALEGEVGVHPVTPAWDATLEEWSS